MSKCCICGKEIIGFGNNPWPIKDSGCCCDECNSTVVIQARLSKRRRPNTDWNIARFGETQTLQVLRTSPLEAQNFTRCSVLYVAQE